MTTMKKKDYVAAKGEEANAFVDHPPFHESRSQPKVALTLRSYWWTLAPNQALLLLVHGLLQKHSTPSGLPTQSSSSYLPTSW